jgi:photosystem II stability/assembly factor-like uncharacterized protein
MTTRLYAGAVLGSSRPHGPQPGGVFRLTLGEDRWQRLEGGLPADAPGRCLAVHPRDARVVYAGTERGLFRSDDGGDRWEAVPLPGGAQAVWSVLFHPRDPRTVYAGTAPPAVYRSDDGGASWRALASFRAPGRVKMNFPCRLLRLAADPGAPDEIYAGLEVDGVVRSLDGGRTWDDVSGDLVKLAERPHLRSRIASDTEIEGMMDTHALCLSPARSGTVFLAVRMGLFRSDDRGATWTDMEVGRFSPLTYARDVLVSPHAPRTLFAALSPAARSESGTFYRSDDLGESWRRIDRGITARSTLMKLALHPADPAQLYGTTRDGQVFGTLDGGESWREWPMPEGVTDVYALACAA